MTQNLTSALCGETYLDSVLRLYDKLPVVSNWHHVQGGHCPASKAAHFIDWCEVCRCMAVLVVTPGWLSIMGNACIMQDP